MEKARGENMVQVQQKEIDLMDLVKILYKNRIMIAMISALVTLASLGGALYVRSNTNNFTAINFRSSNKLDSFYTKKANLNIDIVEIENLFKQDDVVKRMYKIPSLNNLFIKSGVVDNLNERRELLEDTIKLKRVTEGKELKHYQLSMEELDENQEERIIMDTYLDILNKKLYNAYTLRINEKYEVTKQKKEGYEEALTDIENEIKKVISNEPKELFENEKAWDMIQVKYPRLFERRRKINELYIKYGDELVGLEGIKGDSDLNKQIEKISSFYEIKHKSKAKLILIIGIVMGVTLGVMGAFIVEFWNYFEKELRSS